eukprot:TRINITY_DN10033_c0_g1_i1.p1 TRINITY_DN10033_c0_g1~~TRINITY_DN10033_c0_g1_i1.p1  ORF type:complete len:540 (+),score=85.27 TRINITY_DN10033_c0_g1_i1:50-1669(+)
MLARLAALILAAATAHGYNWTLPGDAKWPTLKDWEDLRGDLDGTLDIRGEVTYYALTVNAKAGYPQPAAIVGSATEGDVVKALQFARERNIRICVMGAGTHPDARGTVDNALAINTLQMVSVKTDITGPIPTVTMQTGANWDIVRNTIAQLGPDYVMNADYYRLSSPYGWASAGGYGPLTRMVGYGADSMIAARVVLSNGDVIACNETTNKEVMWALRGGAGSAWGVVTEMTFKLQHLPGLKGLGMVGAYEAVNNISTVMSVLENFAATLPRYVTMTHAVMNDGAPSAINVELNLYCFTNDTSQCLPILQRARDIMPPCVVASPGYCEFVSLNAFRDFWSVKPKFQAVTSFLTSFTLSKDEYHDARGVVAEFLERSTVEKYGFEIGCFTALVGGAAAEIDADGVLTSVSPRLRRAEYVMTCTVLIGYMCLSVPRDILSLAHLNAFEDTLHAITPTAYWGIPSHRHRTPEEYGALYWGSNYPRLVSIKNEIDGQNAFTCFQCVGWDMPSKVDPVMCPACLCSCSNNPDGACSDISPLSVA